MQPIQTTDNTILQFDRYSFADSSGFLDATKVDEKTYSLTRKKRTTENK